MKTNPLSLICIFFCSGIWTAKFVLVYKVCSIYHCENCTRAIGEGNFLDIPLFLLYTCFFLFLIFALAGLNKKVLFSLSLAAAICCAGALHLKNSEIYPANHILNFLSHEPQKVHIRGKVATSPEVSRTFYHSKKTNFTFQTYDLRLEQTWQNVEGLIKVTLFGEREVQYGDELLLQGLLARPPTLRNPGGFDYREYLANHNIFGLLKVKEKDAFLSMRANRSKSLNSDSHTVVAQFIGRPMLGLINQATTLRHSLNDRLPRSIFKFKQKLHQIIFEHLNPPQDALLSAILLGERSRLSPDIKDLFIKTGTIHILPTQYTKKPCHRASHNLTL